jgi:hypothetical protein
MGMVLRFHYKLSMCVMFLGFINYGGSVLTIESGSASEQAGQDLADKR